MKNQILDKFLLVKQEIEATHGPFILFALFEFVGTPGIDVVFSAEWTKPRPDRSVVAESIGLMSEEVLKIFSKEEIFSISALQPLSPDHPVVLDLLSQIHESEFQYIPQLYLRNIVVQDIQVSQAYILAADRRYVEGQIVTQPLQAVA